MSQNVTENAVRELQRLLSILADKVESLEDKVIQQSALITSQTDVIKVLKNQFEGKKNTTSKMPTPTDLQEQPMTKPVRQARLVASAKIIQSGTAKKMTTVNDKVRTPTGGTASRRCNETTSVKFATQDDGPSSRVTMTAKQKQTNNTADDTAAAAAPAAAAHNNDEGYWQTVTRKGRRQTKPRKILTGSGGTINELQTAERMKFIQAWSFKTETSPEQVLTHINKISNCEKYVVEKREIKTKQHAAFVIGFPESLYDVLCNSDAWPLGIKISDWFRIAPRTSERGSLSPAS